MPLRAALPVALLLVPLAARAQDRPVAMPTRDVDVTYQVVADGKPPVRQRMRWDAALARQRLDPLGDGGLYMIVDMRAHRLYSVRNSLRAVLELDTAAMQLTPDPGHGHYRASGADTVAGLACTLWQARSGPPASLCVTADGVMLRLTAGDRMRVEAVSVAYGPADPTAFTIPADYRRVGPEQETTP